VVTTRRLWCELVTGTGPRWLHFNYNTIADTGRPILTEYALTLTFLDAEPLQLTGDFAPWCAATVAHYTYGPDAARFVPTLSGAPS